VLRSIIDLQAAINRNLEQHNDDPKPFIWTKPAYPILAKLHRLPVPLRGSLLTLRWREMDSNFQYASTVRWHRATDLALPPTVKRRSGAPASHAISRDNPL
jgi:hypothetical protein